MVLLPTLRKYLLYNSWRFGRMMSSRVVEDVRIPMPFGYISGVAWGPKDGHPVLCLHGWQDNAGTFDPLVPHMNLSLRCVAIDFPGHGLSSHLPPGSVYHYLEMLLHVKMAVQFMGWSKFSFLGHSMGGGIGLIFAGLYPDCVDSVVSLDLFKPITQSQNEVTAQTVSGIQDAMDIFRKMEKGPPVYSFEDALERLVNGSMGSLNKTTGSILLKRGSRTSDDSSGIVYTRDIRLKIAGIQKLDHETCRTILSCVKCNLLFLRFKSGLILEPRETHEEYMSMYARNCNLFICKELSGRHHAHMDNPQVVAPVINAFLLKHYAEL